MAKELPVKMRLGVLDGMSKTLDKVKDKFPQLSRSVGRTNLAFDLLQKSTEKFSKSAEKIGRGISSIGKGMTIGITAPVLAASVLSVKKFAEIEDALMDVKGSANLSSIEMDDFAKRMMALSKNSTMSQEDLLKLAGTAGDIGVRGVGNLEKFVSTMSKLQKTTGIAGEESADSIVKMLQLTGEGVGNIDRFGSALADVGDKYGVSAKKILESTFGITREISKFGVSSSQAIALAAALEPLGFNAKQASGAVGDAFRGIDDSIREGGKKLQGLQAITGMTGDELKKQFGEDSTVVFKKFLDGVDKIRKSGGPTGDALKFFGASGEKTQIILEALAKDTGALADKMNFSKQAYSENIALSAKYEEATATLSGKLSKFHNNVGVLEQRLGNALAPAVGLAADMLIGLINFLEQHPALEKFIAVVVGLAAALGPVLLAFGLFLTKVPAILTGWNLLTAAMAGFSTVSWAAALPIMLMIAKFVIIGALVIGLIALVWKFRDAIWFGIVTSLTYVWELLKKLGPMFDVVGGAIKGFFGGGETQMGAQGPSGTEAGASFIPQGAPVGGLEAAKTVNPEFMSRTNNARVDINVRAPQSTSVISESQGGFLNINRGLAGAF